MSLFPTEPLKPCPFCGSKSIRLLPLDGYWIEGVSAGWLQADCLECGAIKKQWTKFAEQITAAWNSRANIE